MTNAFDAIVAKQTRQDLTAANSIINGFEYSPLMRQMNELAEQQKAIRTIIEDTIRPNSFLKLSLQMTEAIKPFREISQIYSDNFSNLGSIAKIFEEHRRSMDAFKLSIPPVAIGINESITRLSQPLNDLSAAVNSMRPTAFENITKQLNLLEASQLQTIIEGITRDIDIENIDENELDSLSVSEINGLENEINSVIQNPNEASELSTKAKRLLVLIIVLLIWPTIHALSVNYAYDTWINPQQGQEIDVKELAKHLKAELTPETLSGYRLATVDGLRLREDPSMDSQIITQLSKGALLTIVNKGLRSWIMVEVKIDDEIYVGWVSRRYTKHLN